MRLSVGLIGALMWLVYSVVPGHADKRVALVVGNGAYQHADTLATPVTDARRMKDALEKLHFEVVYGENLDKRALEGAIGSFADAVQEADVALVFFAGHGATFSDRPYVVPVDAQFSSLGRMPYELVPVETLIGELRRAKGLRIAILDACRDNGAEHELKRVAARGGEVTRGLARVGNPEGLILAYATQYLATAADGDPRGDSPFTTALLRHIATPGLDVKDLFFTVGRDVIADTKGSQRPEISVSFYDSYALVPAAQALTAAPAAPSAPQNAADPAAQAWAAVKDTKNVAELEAYIRRFGGSFFADLARVRIEQLKTAQVAAAAPPVAPATPAAPAFDSCGGPVTVSFSSRCAAPLTAVQERGLKPKDSFKECAQCPEMIVVPAGSFTMGSRDNEKGRYETEGPQHVVTFGRPFAVGKFHVTVDEFTAFVAATGYDAGAMCWTFEDGRWEQRSGRSWRNPGFPQAGSHPAVCLSWNDARAYVGWLAKTTGKDYRLLTEAEWEYAARGRTAPGTYPRYSFGNDEKDLCRYGNGADETAKRTVPGAGDWAIAPCQDGYAYTSPVGSFAANAFGLYDIQGNAWQWTEDCWRDNYNGAPANGTMAPTTGDCSRRVLRGGSWGNVPRILRAAGRDGDPPDHPGNYIGFRLARTLPPPS